MVYENTIIKKKKKIENSVYGALFPELVIKNLKKKNQNGVKLVNICSFYLMIWVWLMKICKGLN